MRILYGINGTGNGHIVKSINIIKELKKNYPEVDIDILISGTNHQIDIPFNVKYKFHGLSFEYNKNGSIDYLKTAINLNPIKLIKNLRLDVKSYDKVITDFEPISAWACKLSKKECIGISHQYSFLSTKTPRPKNKSIIGEFVLNKLAPVSFPIGLHFNTYDNFILHPVVGSEIKVKNQELKNHYTVYLPSYSVDNILKELVKYKNTNFEVFTKTDVEKKYKNINIYKNSQLKFKSSLFSCKGIITSSGFETPSEALILGKKIISIPIKGQYEQLCNASALSEMGVFICDDLSKISEFINKDNFIDYKWEDPIPNIIKSIMC